MGWYRYCAKTVVHGAIDLSGRSRRGRRRLADRLTILTYHAFRAGEPIDSGDSLPIGQFERQLRFLREKFAVVSLEQGVGKLADGESRGRAMIAVTIDDGFEDNYTLAWPLLKRYGIPATLFVATDFLDSGRPPWPTQLVETLDSIGAKRHREVLASLGLELEPRSVLRAVMDVYRSMPPEVRLERIGELRREFGVRVPFRNRPLNWRQVAEMHAGGIGIGSHTAYHSMLPFVDPAVAALELASSKRRIEDLLQAPCTTFSYPDGACDDASRSAVERAGYAIAVTQQRGSNAKGDDLLALKRRGIPCHLPFAAFRIRVSV